MNFSPPPELVEQLRKEMEETGQLDLNKYVDTVIKIISVKYPEILIGGMSIDQMKELLKIELGSQIPALMNTVVYDEKNSRIRLKMEKLN